MGLDGDRPDRNGPAGVWFAGDLADPWVAAIADALPDPRNVRRVNCPGEVPERAFDRERPPNVLVVHRSVLVRSDAETIARLRSWGDPPIRVVLCIGPHARHADLERWAPLFDAVVPEATARESVARLVRGAPAETPAHADRSARRRVAVVSTNSAMRAALVESVEAAGYAAAEARDWLDAPSGPAVWDVPVLEPGWADALAARVQAGPVVALVGFADRRLVAEARASGASAVLDLPFDLADLASSLDRLFLRTRNEPAHPTPPRPASQGAGAKRLAGPGRGA